MAEPFLRYNGLKTETQNSAKIAGFSPYLPYFGRKHSAVMSHACDSIFS
jgi:hypothetical protein